MTTEEQKLQVFNEATPMVGGFKLKPFTAQSLLLLQQTKNGFLGELKQDDPELFFHITAFIYIHVKPFSEIKMVSGNPEEFKNKVIEFSENLSVTDLMKSADTIKTIIEKAVVGNDYQIETGEQADPN